MLNLLLKTIVKSENLSVQSSATIGTLIEQMNLNNKGVVAILAGTRPIGVLTERDVVEIVYNGAALDDSVEKHASKTIISTKGDRTIGYALNLCLENNIRRVVVVDDEDNFLGIITQQDLLRYLEEDFYRLTIKVKHILKKSGNLISALPEDSLQEVLRKMVENRISSVPVVQDRKAAGIITEKDILNLTCRHVPLTERVRDHMSAPVETAYIDTPLAEIVEVMNFQNIRRVVIIDRDGNALGLVTIRDVMENLEGDYNKFIERKLRNAKEILNMLPEMLIEIVDVGTEQLIVWANEKVISTFGNEILDKPVTDFLPVESWGKIYAALKKLTRIERIKLKKNNCVLELSGFLLQTYREMEQGRFQLIMRDVTEDIKLSTIDPLTNIYNRRFINGFLMKELERCKRTNSSFSVVISDIDDFKVINDTYGHLAGDIAIKAVSQIIVDTVRNLDVVGRYGGDEFMIVLPETSGDVASHVIDRLRENIASLDISLPKGSTVRTTSSFGIAMFPADGTDIDDLLVAADERLYRAKSMGKNKVA